MRVFSRQGSKEFNAYIAGVLKNLAGDIQAAVGDRFAALILAGGYGRGEGACVIRDGKESLYNDLDLFVVVQTPGGLPDEVWAAVRRYERLLGVEVDIGKPLTPRGVQQLPHELMWQDLVTGHIVLSGDQDLLTKSAPKYLRSPLPPVEALRLMLNRGAGLLQAFIAASGGTGNHDADFIRRNLQKCILAIGDSLLITHGCYQGSVSRRQELLEEVIEQHQVPHGDTLLQVYKRSAAFKLQPDTLSPDQPDLEKLRCAADIWTDVLLYEESLRTGKHWETVSEYCRDPFIREQQQHRGVRKLLRNSIVQAKFGRVSLKYPREMLYRMLPGLLNQYGEGDSVYHRQKEKFLAVWRKVN